MDTLEPGRYYQLGQRAFWLMFVERLGPAIVLLVLSFGMLLFPNIEIFPNHLQILSSISIYVFLVALLIAFGSIVISRLEYRTSRVMIDNSTVHVVRGVLSKHEISIPYRRIQSVEIKQSLLFRILGVGHVVISTTTDLDQESYAADNEYNDEVIEAMDYSLARLLEKTLTDRAEIERIEVKK